MWRTGTWSSNIIPSGTPPPGSQQTQNHGSALRNYTPSPLGAIRRPTGPPGQLQQQRPTLGHRPSTANLSFTSSANASTTSLPMGLKQQQSMGYRKAVSMPMPMTVQHPIEVLEGILGVPIAPPKKKEETADEELWMPSIEDAEAIDFGGLSLEEFAEKEGTVQKRVRKYNENSAEEYEKEKEKFQDLHKSIQACDEVLKSVESYLSAFQTDLGTVSAEIESLQNRSTSLNKKLENRKSVEKLLGPMVEDVILPPNDVRRLVEGEVNDAWVKALYETDRRMKAIDAMDPAKVKAVRDVKPEFEKITHKTIERVRDFFVSRIKALRLPGCHAQTIQQSGFLRYKGLFQFMANHHAQLADEVGQAYINTMRWYYLTHFQRYHKVLGTIKIHAMDKNDTLGQEETTKKGGLSLPGLKSAPPPTYDPFNIGRRIDVLKNRTAPILSAYQAEDDKSTHYPEYPFRHFNAAIMENASAEYSFLTDFFSHKKYDQVGAMFTQIFEPTFALGQTFTRSLVDNTFDAIGTLICVRLNQYAAFEMQKRVIPAAEGYINATNMLLWPRFQIVLSAHCESLRKMTANSKAMAAANAGPAAKQSAAPHALTQRFASLLHGLLALSAESGDDEPVANSLGRLRGDYEAFLTKLSAGISDTTKRGRFMFNNYSLVLTIISDTDGKLSAEQKQHFEALKKSFA
ncbi:Sac2 family-domain-containing protein [Geopyxis carbonaria]|nr:Sac2 family-domain-containing protein [Geopyxis carbonaria]